MCITSGVINYAVSCYIFIYQLLTFQQLLLSSAEWFLFNSFSLINSYCLLLAVSPSEFIKSFLVWSLSHCRDYSGTVCCSWLSIDIVCCCYYQSACDVNPIWKSSKKVAEFIANYGAMGATVVGECTKECQNWHSIAAFDCCFRCHTGSGDTSSAACWKWCLKAPCDLYFFKLIGVWLVSDL